MDNTKIVLGVFALIILAIGVVQLPKTEYFNADLDGDELSNDYEKSIGSDPRDPDSDKDGLNDNVEVRLKTSPTDSDTDKDGLDDGYEVNEFNSNPLLVDTDGDELSDYQEYILGTLPSIIDSDSDGLDDKRETELNTNPLSADSDNDGLDDKQEIQYNCDPCAADSDGDGLDDGFEVNFFHSDPLLVDSDEDGLDDHQENDQSTDPKNKDSDNDGLEDGYEVLIFDSNPLESDTDNDELSDYEEMEYGTHPRKKDTDNDGRNDYEEIRTGSDPLKQDSQIMILFQDIITGLPICFCDTLIDETRIGSTSQDGKLYLQSVEYGQHIVKLDIEKVGIIEVGYIEVLEDTRDYTVLVDMPKPDLRINVRVKEIKKIGDYKGTATITVTNLGDAPSENTYLQVLVYHGRDGTKLDGDDTLLGSIQPGDSVEHVFENLDFVWIYTEQVYVLCFDSYRYLEEGNLISEVGTAASPISRISESLIDVIAENPEKLIGWGLGVPS